ncbi:MAG: hypothetical protein A2Y55_10270 [Actinobacteria bacterium RBG_16_68_12]|nr:MAG: hypothetical protein A2Y55_10270 [Actinobacteria bacterium RBG_16_68_12]
MAAHHVSALDAGQADRDALPGLRPLDLAVVHLHAPNPYCASRRLDTKLVPFSNRARPERPGDHGADPAERERAVDMQPRRPARLHPLGAIRHSGERGAELVETLTGLCAHRNDRGLGDELARLFTDQLERLGVDCIDLRHGDDAAIDSEQPQDREVLVRLRPRAFAGVDDEQKEIDAGCAGDHRAYEALVARHVDDREPAAFRKLERRVPEVDRDPAASLLRQPVRVLPGQSPDEPRLAVVDVTRRPER